MKKRGYKWSHVTLVSIESGDRPLRLSEAVDLAEVLGTDVRLFFEPTGDLAFDEAHRTLSAARRMLMDAYQAYFRDVWGSVGRLGDVELSDELEDRLFDSASITPLDLLADVMSSSPSAGAQSLLNDEWSQWKANVGGRMVHTADRMEPIIKRWEDDLSLIMSRPSE